MTNKEYKVPTQILGVDRKAEYFEKLKEEEKKLKDVSIPKRDREVQSQSYGE